MLISGAGVAGPALAYWLLRYGFTPTLVERAPRPRTGGYMIDFWGVGYDVVERMGLLPEVLGVGYDVGELRIVDRAGHKVGGFDVEGVRKATRGRYTSLRRGDLARILHRSIDTPAEVIFGDSITALQEHEDRVTVFFERTPARSFDLVVGADGLHSTVRRLAFGPDSDFERFLEYTVAAFAFDGYRPRDEGAYVAYSVPRLQVARFSMRDDRTMFLLVAADASPESATLVDRRAQEAYLKRRFARIGWETDRILELVPAADDVYFDRVSQIRMNRWCTRRVALVGDAAYCPSLLAGEGAGLALLGAYVLAGELVTGDSHDSALERYEGRLRRFLDEKQAAARRFAGSFAPKTHLGLFLRNWLSRALSSPFMADLTLGRSLRDDIELPRYSAGT
ncbi:MAG TPA: FAD-binding domain [Polyangiaceae bacterium]|nr:FAD-binding domain [Polyangiaceae bacterium]